MGSMYKLLAIAALLLAACAASPDAGADAQPGDAGGPAEDRVTGSDAAPPDLARTPVDLARDATPTPDLLAAPDLLPQQPDMVRAPLPPGAACMWQNSACCGQNCPPQQCAGDLAIPQGATFPCGECDYYDGIHPEKGARCCFYYNFKGRTCADCGNGVTCT